MEATAYRSLEAFTDVVMRVVMLARRSRQSLGWAVSVFALFTEVRVPAVSTARITWVTGSSEQLLRAAAFHSRPGPDQWQGAVYRELQPGKSLIVRYGPGMGQALDPNYHLRRITPPKPDHSSLRTSR